MEQIKTNNANTLIFGGREITTELNEILPRNTIKNHSGHVELNIFVDGEKLENTYIEWLRDAERERIDCCDNSYTKLEIEASVGDDYYSEISHFLDEQIDFYIAENEELLGGIVDAAFEEICNAGFYAQNMGNAHKPWTLFDERGDYRVKIGDFDDIYACHEHVMSVSEG